MGCPKLVSREPENRGWNQIMARMKIASRDHRLKDVRGTMLNRRGDSIVKRERERERRLRKGIHEAEDDGGGCAERRENVSRPDGAGGLGAKILRR
jgi:hypothetical protein